MQPLLGCYFYKCAHLIAARSRGWLVRGHRADDVASLERSHTTQSKRTIVNVTDTIVTTCGAMQQTHRRFAVVRYLFICARRRARR